MAKFKCLGAGAILWLPLLVQAQHPGHVDLDAMDQWGQAEVVVDVRLGGWMLDLARDAVGDGDREAKALLSGIDDLRVRVFRNVDADQWRDRAADFLADLTSKGWESLAKVRDDGERVDVLIKGSKQQLDGITVIVFDQSEEVVMVNIAGRIDPQDIRQILGDGDLIHAQLDLDSL